MWVFFDQFNAGDVEGWVGPLRDVEGSGAGAGLNWGVLGSLVRDSVTGEAEKAQNMV